MRNDRVHDMINKIAYKQRIMNKTIKGSAHRYDEPTSRKQNDRSDIISTDIKRQRRPI